MSTGVDDETILDVLRESDEPELTTTAVADALPISRGRTRTRLQSLVDDGRVERRRVGNNIVWWLPERDDERASADDDAESGTGDGDEATEDEDEATEDEDEESGPESVEVESAGDDVTVRVRENGSVPARDDGDLARLLGVAAVALLALALLRRLRRR